MAIETPTPSSGLSADDIKAAIAQARRAQKKYPAIELILTDVPPEYEPDTDEPDPDAGDPQPEGQGGGV